MPISRNASSLLLLSLAACAALTPIAQAQVAPIAPPPDVYGTMPGATWIDATQFTLPAAAGVPPLTHQSHYYFNSPGSAVPAGHIASLDAIPNGAAVAQFACLFNDGSATNDFSFSFEKTVTDVAAIPPTRTTTVLLNASSSGTPGVSVLNIPMGAAETISRAPTFALTTYHLRANVANDTSFSGCLVFWLRQISPAPPNATFSDVPTNAQFFREIEALVASGITAGCTASTYCPDANVTRRQMAAFFARALGLNWPQ